MQRQFINSFVFNVYAAATIWLVLKSNNSTIFVSKQVLFQMKVLDQFGTLLKRRRSPLVISLVLVFVSQ